MQFGTMWDNEILGANRATRDMWTCDVLGLDIFKCKILYLAAIDVHNTFFSYRENALQYLLDSLRDYSEVLNMNFEDSKNPIISQFWTRALTRKPDGEFSCLDDFLYNVRKIHGQCELVDYLEDKMHTYFPGYFQKQLRRYGFAIYNYKNNSKHVLSFGTSDDEEKVLSHAERFSGYQDDKKIASTIRHNMKHYYGTINLLDTRSGDYKWKDSDVSLFRKAVELLDKESIIKLIDKNDAFYGVIDYCDKNDDEKSFVDIINTNLKDDGSIIVTTFSQHHNKYKASCSVIRDDKINTIWHEELSKKVIKPGCDSQEIINLMIYSAKDK